ncbi:hypothetical protein A3D77_03750 [Candidatus Gottesmanbacteria bacterium RIFCSPHIGHO2_02_FULL_39_11]|uniref:Glycosyl hydrolases family 39 N-terminal catalytic domain-containing protein n=1 Tax=Candidatus Gottesmanbacteria bacterium RIFCSPHIGHO2_02_FULL_39_11 TaxID=1798382 RepID=A0A1F5ZXC0_9BACT|nr:MAG: hypothetical protein A3D77_03750 [Candidatus Gottesmanbacteria bacterium RIFCSPHIGHO2_02_FULL_39_11]
MRKKLIGFLLLFFLLPLLIYSVFQIQNYLTRASVQPANIVIDTQKLGGKVTRPWASYAQGGEETEKVFTNLIAKMQPLKPRFIRIDHIYDFYDVVHKTEGGFSYDFSKLDKTVDEILSTGALPFFSLSYMPRVFTSNNSVIDTPTDWQLWKTLVTKTIEQYSGSLGKNLSGVYYEVWNEPELPQFGAWKLSGDKDYRQMYYYAAQGAKEASVSNPFFLGGPSVGSYYRAWVFDFLTYVSANSLRLDFYSWHRYSKNPVQIKEDALSIRKNLSAFPPYSSIPLIVSEWGIESENKPTSGSKKAASFAIASISEFFPYVFGAFDFEIKNGPPPQGGQWGLFTHEQDNSPLSPKPRFKSFETLESLKGNMLTSTGVGTYVKAVSSKSEDEIYIVLTNYDYAEKNSENVPVTLTHLSPGSYEVKTTYVFENAALKNEEIVTSGTLKKTVPVLPNQIVLLKITKMAPIARFVTGKTKNPFDQAFILSSGSLTFSQPEFSLHRDGHIHFDFQLNNSGSGSYILMDAPYSTSSGILNRLFLAKQQEGTTPILKFGVSRGSREEYSTLLPITTWKPGEWRGVDISWMSTRLVLQVEKEGQSQIILPTTIQNGNILTFYPIDAAIDNLSILSGNSQITRTFDGDINK